MMAGRALIMWTVSLFIGLSLSAHSQDNEIGNTLPFFSPKISTTRLQFAYGSGSEIRMDLSDHQPMILDEFLKTFPDVTVETHDCGNNDNRPFNRRQKSFLKKRLPDRIGQKYIVYFPDSYEIQQYTLTDFRLKSSVDKVLLGFEGVLQASGKIIPPLCSVGSRRGSTALAFACNAIPLAAVPMDAIVREEATLARVGKALDAVENFKEQRIVECRSLYLEYPKVKGYIASVTGTITQHVTENGVPVPDLSYVYHPTLMFCFADIEGNLEMIPFPTGSAATGPNSLFGYEYLGGLLIDINDGPDCDDSPRRPLVSILPDCDGDGVCELFVDNTIGILFRFDKYRGVPGSEERWRAVWVKETVYFAF